MKKISLKRHWYQNTSILFPYSSNQGDSTEPPTGKIIESSIEYFT
jgi:hypothetical protein